LEIRDFFGSNAYIEYRVRNGVMATALAIFTAFIAGVGFAAVINAVRIAHRKHVVVSGQGMHDKVAA
jgi:hypothetical protein